MKISLRQTAVQHFVAATQRSSAARRATRVDPMIALRAE
jgi:hypothetical protein